MKTLKTAKVRSFAIDMDMYTNFQYREMLDNEKGIFYSDYDFGACVNSCEYEDEPLRISHSAVEEVKVVYNKEFKQYMTIVKTKSGNVYYVQL